MLDKINRRFCVCNALKQRNEKAQSTPPFEINSFEIHLIQVFVPPTPPSFYATGVRQKKIT